MTSAPRQSRGSARRLAAYEAEHAGEPGRVTVRRLTSAEYAYAIRDLTGIDIKVGVDASSDSVGGEGFTNFGDVQFVQDTSIERYLEAAKLVADHAVDRRRPARLLRRHRQDGPGALRAEPHRRPLRRERVPRRVRRRRAPVRPRPLRQGVLRRVVLQAPRCARRSGGDAFAASRRRKASPAASPNTSGRSSTSRTPAIRLRVTVDGWKQSARRRRPTSQASIAKARAGCDDLYKALTTWPSWFFARGDLAAGGAGDESPLVFDDTSLKAEPTHHYTYAVGDSRRPRAWPAPVTPGPSKVYLTFTDVNPTSGIDARRRSGAIRAWSRARRCRRLAGASRRSAPQLRRRAAAGRGRGAAGPVLSTQPLRAALPADAAGALAFGTSPDGTFDRPRRFRDDRHRVVHDRCAAGRQRPRVPGGRRARQRQERRRSRHDLRSARRLAARRRPARAPRRSAERRLRGVPRQHRRIRRRCCRPTRTARPIPPTRIRCRRRSTTPTTAPSTTPSC